jgi:hypothetical protein
MRVFLRLQNSVKTISGDARDVRSSTHGEKLDLETRFGDATARQQYDTTRDSNPMPKASLSDGCEWWIPDLIILDISLNSILEARKSTRALRTNTSSSCSSDFVTTARLGDAEPPYRPSEESCAVAAFTRKALVREPNRA